MGAVRHDWTNAEVEALYDRPLLDLVYDAASVHRANHDPRQVQQCTLLSIKTGGCPETCNYCAQSSSWKEDTGLKAEKLMGAEDVLAAARRAKEAGSTRFCMGTAWRGPSQVGKGQFDRVLGMVSEVRDMGMEVCATLGMLDSTQARQLREAGLTAYNHNVDTSPEYYPKVTTSRNYEDRLNTIAAVREAGISVCCGGILGLGEEEKDRASMLRVLANLPEHPESVPINALVPVKGTPLENLEPPSGLEMVRAIAVARIVMPRTVVRLSAGRITMSPADQALAFLAGANSVFTGDKLLTTANNEATEDAKMFEELGLVGRPAFVPYVGGGASSDGSEWGENASKVAPSIREGAERARKEMAA
jgi:biotin synthase